MWPWACGFLVPMALAACGVPDDGPTTSQFATKVERICTASRARINALSAMSASDAASIARGLERTVEEQRIAVSSIRAIPTPKGQRPKVDAWLESVDKMLKELESIGSALDGGDAAMSVRALRRRGRSPIRQMLTPRPSSSRAARQPWHRSRLRRQRPLRQRRRSPIRRQVNSRREVCATSSSTPTRPSQSLLQESPANR